ncbi:DegT/DnrJ/EryC1/StrS family aminotransferase [Flavihumibacter fluvii]|uniref:DegT/DnrJ/EryC1/StrS family aminotransferase n=1 Tax=Flavihumibacter fluvii TaxID=2838157 RepID=UPI001BDE895F|nr:DegT/DnrJ/EryC1/StrS family aminotransferase [Flavihumibacter fluvii]ULQ52438.1 DegT/DnrJ/EryC1/StrS family aminotransferase [Flavihumibacter fluvii]
MINVTKTHLPPLEEYTTYLEGIWKRNWVTNYGPLVQELEEKLKTYFGVQYILFVSNGTLALQLAIKAAGLTGEIITTPFSYVATTASIAWENCTPVFADIDDSTLCIDPNRVIEKITDKTTAIIATHVYGNPCNIEALEKIGKHYNLKIIYDAAHSFGVTYKDKSLLQYGDISTISFHATKLFHTIEGGAITTNDPKLAHRISQMSNFGHTGPTTFDELGINAKNSEFHAAMGLCMLPRIESLILQRKHIAGMYDKLLHWGKISKPVLSTGTNYNYAYYPVIFENESVLLQVIDALNRQEIYPRRYFYPSLSQLPYVSRQSVPVAERISPRVLCLPFYPELPEKDISAISRIINNNC